MQFSIGQNYNSARGVLISFPSDKTLTRTTQIYSYSTERKNIFYLFSIIILNNLVGLANILIPSFLSKKILKYYNNNLGKFFPFFDI